ncbi:MAG: CDP-2,3-bis-(O-geranylgeranyl)-sn-glycerol synthase [Candidatus Micrarchaeia archaeon]
MLDIFSIILFILPPYIANAIPVLFGGGTPIDLGMSAWDGRRILGDGKTLRGLFAGILAGILTGYAEYTLLGRYELFIISVYSSCGAMFGDIVGSFIKRRMGMERGKPSFVMDQLLFIIFALVFSYATLAEYIPSVLFPESVLFILLLTYLMHRGMNIVANKLGLKKVPW